MMRLGRVAQVSPLLVRLNGDLTSTSAEPMYDFSTATVDVTEVVVESIENRRFAWYVDPPAGGGGGGGTTVVALPFATALKFGEGDE